MRSGTGNIEANFEADGTEYRLGAEPWTVDDYLSAIADAGFESLEASDHLGDERLVAEVPAARKYLGEPVLLLVRARRAA